MSSVAEASSRVWRTAGWSPQPSSMPTDCERWPGRTNANGFIVGTLVVEQRRTPGEAAADAFEHQRVAAPDLAAAHRVVQGERDRGGRRVAVPVDGRDQLLGGELQLLG